MNPSHIRSQFLEFFRERGHEVVPSAPVVPHGDPTLLFTNAGMNQFKDVFLGTGSRPWSRAVDSQKCIRVSGKHNDLEEVGPSPSHHTFFEMLGNWSFGDYYKREAIRWAWDLLTTVWDLDKDRLYATVFAGDDQVGFDQDAYDIWKDEIGLPATRISRHSRKDNFWEMGEVGPCGPCSELHYDFGSDFCRKGGEQGHVCAVNGDCGRIVELWNLVFIQYRRDESGILHSLPNKHVDTGAGFERILKALEGVPSNYETSIFKPLIEAVAQISGVPYARDNSGIPHRVIADHIRMLSFAIADGVLPSNDGRGYVVRRVLRRAARYARTLGLEEPFLRSLLPALIDSMGDAYPELSKRFHHIEGVLKSEEESFSRTLGRGLELFGEAISRLNSARIGAFPGDEAFKLYDTYGFPLDLTELMARERGLTVDIDRFDQLMAAQRDLARGERKFAASSGEWEPGLITEFTGYKDWQQSVEARILAVRREGEAVELVTEQTPFYSESGGQISDAGSVAIDGHRGQVVEVKRLGAFVVHRVEGFTGSLQVGDSLTLEVNTDLRRQTQYNHTGTHLIHKALRRLVGPHCNQAGSLVAPDRLRFDFTHHERLTEEQIATLEDEVNSAIRTDYPVEWYEVPYKEAIASGITALFGEKYGDIVRVVDIGGSRGSDSYSRELCGGCHVSRTGEIGLFRIVTEEAASAGVRRIVAVTGEHALNWARDEHRQLEAVQDIVGSRGSSPVEKLRKTIAEKKALEKDLEQLLGLWAAGEAAQLLAAATPIEGVAVVRKQYDRLDVERLKMVGDAIRSQNPKAAALLVSAGENGAGQLVCVVGDDAIRTTRLKAGELVGQAARLAGGGGGGRPHMATAGTKTPELLGEAVRGFEGLARNALIN
ncbi:MAG: alanine--tRNA ligase [Calditrichaeota bacterium]|nr:alanine--tRNA ligase [Calditrichota bacterium]